MPSTQGERRVKVTFCVYDKPDSVGGPVSWIQRLVPSLRERGIEPRCLFLLHWGDTGPALSYLQSLGIECKSVVAHDRTVDRVKWILDQLEQDPPDVFVPNLVVAGYFAARWARESGIPTVGVLHSDDDYYRAIQDEFVFGDPAYQVSAIVCVSREIERQVNLRSGSGTIVRRIPYGVPVPEQSASEPDGVFRIAYVGRLAEEQKRIGDLTRAFCRVVKEVPRTEALIFGDGPDAGNVKAILAAEGSGLPVRLVGAVASEAIQSHLQNVHAIILLSDYEGLPISLLEAMACGCVPVCLRIRSGIPELVDDGVTGLLVDDRDGALTRAIERLAQDSSLWSQLSTASRAFVAENFSNERCATDWSKLLHDVSEGSNQSRIRLPRLLPLPAPNPSLESPDYRSAKPGSSSTFGKARMLLGKYKRILIERLG